MRRRVLTAIMTVTTIVVLLFAVPLGFVLERLLDERGVFALEHRADLAARNIDLVDKTDPPDASEFPDGPERFALYDAKGVRLAGRGPDNIMVADFSVTSTRDRTSEVGPNLVTTLPVMSGETLRGFVRAERSLAAIDGTTRRALAVLVLCTVSVLVIGWVIARRLARTIAASTQTLRDAAVRLGNGDFTTTAPTTGIPELDEVGSALNSTAQQLGDLIDREQAFSADVSHQLRTPIAGLRTALETELAFPRDDQQTIVRESLSDVERFEQTVGDILAFARSERSAYATAVDVTKTISESHHRWATKFTSAGRLLTVNTLAGPCDAVGNQGLLAQALDALLDNALKHGDGLTTLAVTSDDATVTVQVSDSGLGNHRTDTSGLGLALTQRLVRAQNGRLITELRQPNPSVRIVLMRVSGRSQNDNA
jgi:signal transduction histidine kinase